jgi:glycosyltransferase involved in cell wall biosynthesis
MTLHISVCICAYKRPELLARTLKAVCAQDTGGLFTFSIVVSDNDKAESSRSVVEKAASQSEIPVKYCVEPRRNIAMARNTAVANATGEFVAFVDDDEIPIGNWLLTLFQTISSSAADGVLGPVPPQFDDATPRWVIDSKLFERKSHPTGMILSWGQCRTGNVLLKRELFSRDSESFDPRCLSGEDQDFFRRKIAEGHTFIWCREAPAFEVVPATRWRRGFLVRRALFRGVFAQRNHGLQPARVLQALISVPVYVVLLPFAFVVGQARFMTCVFKLSYHVGRLCALLGFNPIQATYVTE